MRGDDYWTVMGGTARRQLTGRTLREQWDDENDEPTEDDLGYTSHNILARTHNYATESEVLHDGGWCGDDEAWLSADMDTYVYDVRQIR